MGVDIARVSAVAEAALGSGDCVCTDTGTTTYVTVGRTVFAIDLVDGDGKQRTQADIEAIAARLCNSEDAKKAEEK
jgi:hypothetical protein